MRNISDAIRSVFTKKRGIALCAILAAIALLICFCPLVKPIDISLQGSQYNTETQQTKEIMITVKGYLLDYLFRYDTCKVSMTVGDKQWQGDIFSHVFAGGDGRFWTASQYYVLTLAGYQGVIFCFDQDFSNVAMKQNSNTSTVYVASADPETTVQDLLEMFDSFF